MDRQPHHLDTPLLVALAVSFVVGLVFWTTWPLWPFRLLVVLMHESGHAAATLLLGGSVDRIQVKPNEAGLTLGRMAPSLWGQIVVSSAGYVGSTISGCVLLWIAARSRSGRWPLLALATWTGLVAHQQVIFGGLGQTLTLRHDTSSQESYVPGTILALRHVVQSRELTEGLAALLGLE